VPSDLPSLGQVETATSWLRSLPAMDGTVASIHRWLRAVHLITGSLHLPGVPPLLGLEAVDEELSESIMPAPVAVYATSR
jgi:hypothetical protein